MRAIKQLFDPRGLLNPGVIINDDRDAHLKNLKPLPAVRSDRRQVHRVRLLRAECPSHELTLSPRQRIVGWREIAVSSTRARPSAQLETMRELYDFHGIDTCAACGLCATACPVGIETGLLIKALRGRRASADRQAIAAVAADHFGALTSGVRAGSGRQRRAARAGGSGRDAMPRSNGLRSLSGGRVPKWSPALPRPARFQPRRERPSASPRSASSTFPSCAARTMGAQRGDDEPKRFPPWRERLFAQGRIRRRLSRTARRFVLRPAVREQGALRGGRSQVGGARGRVARRQREWRLPIVFDTSPCTYRMKRRPAAGGCRCRTASNSSTIAFCHGSTSSRSREPVAIHPVCSVRKMGTVDKLAAIARALQPRRRRGRRRALLRLRGGQGLQSTGAQRARAAAPEGGAARAVRQRYSSSRTCEIGLSEYSGFPYRSIIHLVDAARARGTRAAPLPRRRKGSNPRRSDLPVDDDSTPVADPGRSARSSEKMKAALFIPVTSTPSFPKLELRRWSSSNVSGSRSTIR